MTTASAIVTSLSLDLNDQEPGFEYTRWTAFQLKTYVLEAIAHLIEDARLASDDSYGNIHHIVVKLDSTLNWQRSCECGCEEIVRVNGLSTKDGEVFEILPRLDDDEQMVWKNSTMEEDCACNEAYRGYVINETNPCEFRVVPPFVDGKDHYVELECYKSPSVEDVAANVPARWVAPIKQWALYRALIVDSENNPAVAGTAKTHLEAFFNLLKDSRDTRTAHKAEVEKKRLDRLKEKYLLMQATRNGQI